MSALYVPKSGCAPPSTTVQPAAVHWPTAVSRSATARTAWSKASGTGQKCSTPGGPGRGGPGLAFWLGVIGGRYPSRAMPPPARTLAAILALTITAPAALGAQRTFKTIGNDIGRAGADIWWVWTSPFHAS